MATREELEQKINKLEVNMNRTDRIVNGGEDEDVLIDGGQLVPSIRKWQKELGEEYGFPVELVQQAEDAADRAEDATNRVLEVSTYTSGLELTSYNQLIRDENGEFWRVSGQVDLPYVTTGAGIPEDDALVPAGDAVLRQDLSNPDKGAALVAGAVIYVPSIERLRNINPSHLIDRQAFRLTDGGRAGDFVWMNGDFSTDVSRDPNMGVWVAPAGQTGQTGAWKRVHTPGYVCSDWFHNNDLDDYGPAIRAAAYYLRANSVGIDGTASGVGVVQLPKGELIVRSTISMVSIFGMEIHGAGERATVLTYTPSTGSMFSISTYLNVTFRDMTIRGGSSDPIGEIDTTCFAISGGGGGAMLRFERMRLHKFGTMFRHTSSGNADTNYYFGCAFQDFKTFLYSRSSQNVVNEIDMCSFYTTPSWREHSDAIFDGHGFQQLDMRNINIAGFAGTMFKFSNTSGGYGPSHNYILTNVKWEWLGGDKTKLVEATSLHAEFIITLNSCSISGNEGSLTKPTNQIPFIELRGGTVIFNGGSFPTGIVLHDSPKTYSKGVRCYNMRSSPRLLQVTPGQAGYFPNDIVYRGCADRPDHTVAFMGSRGAALQGYSHQIVSEAGYIVTGSSRNHSFRLGTKFYLRELVLQRTFGATSVEVSLFSDEDRTQLIGEYSASLSSGLAVIPVNLIVDKDLYMRVSAASGVGGGLSAVYDCMLNDNTQYYP